MTLTAWIAIAVILVTVYCLIKRYETRLVLFTAGLFLCCIAMKPMARLINLLKAWQTLRSSWRSARPWVLPM